MIILRENSGFVLVVYHLNIFVFATRFFSTRHSISLFNCIPNSGHNLSNYKFSTSHYLYCPLEIIQISNLPAAAYSQLQCLFITSLVSKAYHFNYHHLLMYLSAYLFTYTFSALCHKGFHLIFKIPFFT